jgi:hypothetical protein
MFTPPDSCQVSAGGSTEAATLKIPLSRSMGAMLAGRRIRQGLHMMLQHLTAGHSMYDQGC